MTVTMPQAAVQMKSGRSCRQCSKEKEDGERLSGSEGIRGFEVIRESRGYQVRAEA